MTISDGAADLRTPGALLELERSLGDVEVQVLATNLGTPRASDT